MSVATPSGSGADGAVARGAVLGWWAVSSDGSEGRRSGWWLASDGNYYPPELHPDRRAAPPPGTDLARAGASAAREAERLASVAEERQSESEQWSKGAAGERATAAVLAGLPFGFVVFHDLHVPGSPANVDHLVVGPTGVFLVDSKAYSGRFTAGDDTLWRGRYPIRREVDTLDFITGRVATHLETSVRAVLCFTEAALPQRRTQLGAVVAVELPELTRLIVDSPVVLTGPQVDWFARLAAELVEPVDVNPSATERYEFQPPTRSPRAPARNQRRDPVRPRSGTRRRSPGCAGIAFLLAAVAIVALVVLPAAVRSLSESVTTNAPTPTTEPPRPGVTLQFTCPGPERGYDAVFVRPPDARSYEILTIVVALNGIDLPPVRWTYDKPPAPLAGIWPGTPMEVRTTTSLRPGAPPVVERTTAPPEAC